jgi:DNA-directed RNA polymerase specialized sigma24 family protein
MEGLLLESMAETIEEQTLEKLDQILRILVVTATRGVKQRERIELLDGAGFSPKAIAELLGTTSNTVRVELVALRKAKRAGKGRKAASV